MGFTYYFALALCCIVGYHTPDLFRLLNPVERKYMIVSVILYTLVVGIVLAFNHWIAIGLNIITLTIIHYMINSKTKD